MRSTVEARHDQLDAAPRRSRDRDELARWMREGSFLMGGGTCRSQVTAGNDVQQLPPWGPDRADVAELSGCYRESPNLLTSVILN